MSTESDLLDTIGRGPLLAVRVSIRPYEPLLDHLLERCAHHGIVARACSLIECTVARAQMYPRLVILLPATADEDWAQQARRVNGLLHGYRTRRPDRLATLLGGDGDWDTAGVVQLVGPQELLDHRDLHESRGCVCLRISNDRPMDLLDLHLSTTEQDTRPESPSRSDEQTQLRELWRYTKSWQIDSIHSVPLLLDTIEQCRDYFENPANPSLFRPDKKVDANRLSFILDGIPHKPSTVQARKTWEENGARVWRHVRDQLRAVVPSLSRPNNRDNTKGAQRDLQKLYVSLCLLRENLGSFPQHHWDTLFMDD